MKTAVVTGCTKGIGEAITKKLLEHDCRVYGGYSSDVKSADELVESIRDLKENLTLIQADLTSWSGVDQFVEKIRSEQEEVDYLVLNAAMTDRTPFGEISRDDWERVMHLNLYSPFFVTQGLNDLMRNNGRIIFIGAVMGQYPHAMSISYAVSKAGLHQMAKNLVKEFADREITVNVVAPGFVDTPWQKNKDPEHKKRIENKIALKRFALPEEIADMCWSVIGNPYINGSLINIDGGYDYR